MVYKRFIKKVGENMDIPTYDEKLKFIEGDDSIHVTVGVGYVLKNERRVSRDIVPQGKQFIQALDLLKQRGAVRRQDYLICLYENNKSDLVLTLHTTHAFLCDEDFDSSLERE